MKMRYILLGYFTEIFLYLCLICYEISFSGISVYATSLNTSEEIKNIFSLPEVTDSVLKGAPKIGNFAEGGPIIEHLTQSSIKTSNKNLFKNSDSLKTISASSNPVKRQNISSLYTNLLQNKSHNSFGLSSDKILPTKLTETESNPFLGMPGVFHNNGTFSAKPHKDTHYNKIVPRKGVDTENEASHGFTQDFNNNYLKYPLLPNAEKKQHNSLISQISKTVSESDFPKETIIEDKNSFNNSKKKSKLKPSITKVPYDVEVVTEILSKDQQKVFVPVIVSLFLLPLIGILMFFLWRRVKGYWDKRYYKRTDFLIDGMYND